MYYTIDWQVHIGNYKLAMIDSVEIHKSVELLANTCIIKLPATLYNKAIEVTNTTAIEGKIKRGDKVKVWLGYNTKSFDKKQPEFEGYLLNISTDDGSLVINCEDDLFLLRKPVADKKFKKASLQTLLEYVVKEAMQTMIVNTEGFGNYPFYDEFVISKAEGSDVLKKIADETKANIYLTKQNDGSVVLHCHPPYTKKHGYVRYSFQKNIETSDLKYKNATDRKVQIVIERTGKDGKTIKETYGTTGGETKTIKGDGMSQEALKQKAENEYKQLCYDGYEGGVTTWLLPNVLPGYSAEIIDADYTFKNGWYFVKTVTTTVSSSGASRKVDLGIKLTQSAA